MKGDFMKKQIRLAVLFFLLALLSISLPSAVLAGDNEGTGNQILNMIKNNPCGGSLHITEGGTIFGPVVSCAGWKGASSSIGIPVRAFDTQPAFPIANIPFYLGIGIDPYSALYSFPTKEVITWDNKIKFNNYRTELRLSPVHVTGAFNGELSGDSSVSFNNWYAGVLSPSALVAHPELISLNELDKFHGESIKNVYGDFYNRGANTIVVLGLSALTSSYHAANPSTYHGEPAYRLGVSSYYLLEARATWRSYQKWEFKENVTICSPGRNSEGWHECFLSPDDRFWRGRYTTVAIYDWGIKVTGNQGPWIPIKVVTTDKVRWSDGTIHDHIPILVYQSQPLLQKP